MPDDLAAALVNVVYDYRIADRDELEELAKAAALPARA